MAMQPRRFPSEGFELLPTDVQYDEERLSMYRAAAYFPVTLGEVFNSQYQVVAKLGFGTTSTAWLCRDLQENKLRTLKVCTIGKVASQDLAVSNHFKSVETDHPGIANLRIALHDFKVDGPNGVHQCLVFPALGMNLQNLRSLYRKTNKGVDKRIVQVLLSTLVVALDFMHLAGVVHTDLSPNNILLGANDAALSKVEQAELVNPSPRKVLTDRTIHLSYRMPTTYDPPFIADFGAARLGEPEQKHTGDVMPGIFRAPEIVAGMDWDSKIDVWSLGLTIWELLENTSLFEPYKDGGLNDEVHFAQMVSLMGAPPTQFLERSETCRKYWDPEGAWIAETPIPDQTLESRVTQLGGKDKELLLLLLRKILTWLPEDRASAEDLWDDAFINQEEGVKGGTVAAQI